MELYSLPKFDDIININLVPVISEKTTSDCNKSFSALSSSLSSDTKDGDKTMANDNPNLIHPSLNNSKLSRSTTSLPYQGNRDPNNSLTKLTKYATTTVEEEIRSQKSNMKLELNDVLRHVGNQPLNNNIHEQSPTHNRNSVSDSRRRSMSRRPTQLNRRLTQESIISSFPFRASAHRSQIFPIVDTETLKSLWSEPQHEPIDNTKINKNIAITDNNGVLKLHDSTAPSSSSSSSSSSSALNTRSIRLTRRSLTSLINRSDNETTDFRSVGSTMTTIGHRISERDVNFNIVHNMLTGIKISCESIATEKNSPFNKTNIDKYIFNTQGKLIAKNEKIRESYGFKFKDYYGEQFLKIRQKFNIDNKDYLDSLTSQYVLNELNSPGKSGSFFYFSKDYKYIIKTIHHSEHIHLRENLNKYFNHINKNPHTFLCQYYGLHRVKLPRSFKNQISNRKIYLVVMYNVFPPLLRIDLTYDLKGSKLGRFTNVDNERYENKIRKDMNWINENEKIIFKTREEKAEFSSQLWRDVKLLADMNTMDYSLLVGIHFKQTKDDNDSTSRSYISQSSLPSTTYRSDGGGIITNDEMVYYIGIIDCLTNYSIIKKLETLIRSLNHKTINISAIPPNSYATRFYKFIESSTEVIEEDSTTGNYMIDT